MQLMKEKKRSLTTLNKNRMKRKRGRNEVASIRISWSIVIMQHKNSIEKLCRISLKMKIFNHNLLILRIIIGKKKMSKKMKTCNQTIFQIVSNLSKIRIRSLILLEQFYLLIRSPHEFVPSYSLCE